MFGKMTRVSIIMALIVAFILTLSPTTPSHASTSTNLCRIAPDGPGALPGQTLRLNPHPDYNLPADPDWSVNPALDPNWRFRFHALRWLYPAIVAADTDPSLVGPIFDTVADWAHDNPFDHPAGDFAWNDMSTAGRVLVLVCISERLGEPEWLTEILNLHGAILSRDDFYVKRSNHALNQNIALGVLGCRAGVKAWTDLAIRRFNTLAAQSIDAQGLTNEQSVSYQSLNSRMYADAFDRLGSCGLTPDPEVVRRHRLMPGVLANLTGPDGCFAMLGDTFRVCGQHPGTRAQATYRGGFATARDGQTFLTLRFGPAPIIHGHVEGGSFTLDAGGRKLIRDPGALTYAPGEWRRYALRPVSSNIVLADGVKWSPKVMKLVAPSHSSARDSWTLWGQPATGVSWIREVRFYRATRQLMIADYLSADHSLTFRQRFHTDVDAAKLGVGGWTIPGCRVRADGFLRQRKGWVGEGYGQVRAATVVEQVKVGARVVLKSVLEW